VFSILYFAILIAMLFIGLVDLNLGGLKINLKEQGIYNFPEIWNFITWIVALLKIFLGLIIVFSICQEFTNRMFKQNVIDGLSRKEFIASKLLTIFTFAFVSTLLVFIISLIIGYSYSKSTDSELVFKEMFFIGHYFLKLLAFFCFLMFLSILFRKSIFVFLAFFVWWIVEIIFGVIESVIRFYGMNLQEQIDAKKNTIMFSDFLPLSSMSNIVPSPLFRLGFFKMQGVVFEFQYPTASMIACGIWCILFIAGSYWILKRRDW
jgi:ABC-type transport system involved in multi-copper enzyme maturation permease subunit